MIDFNSKGKVLQGLQDKLERFSVPQSFLFSTDEWFSKPSSIIDQIQHTFGSKILIIRSSAADEDGALKALAGEYDSVLNVPCIDTEFLRSGIEQVFSSFSKNGASRGLDEILVQEMVKDVVLSGVIFTHELNTGAPYFVINYDDTSGLTNTVTSGLGEYSNRTLYIHRSASDQLRSERFQILISAVYELEQFLNSEFLDIEFALDDSLHPHLLQVRAITTQPNWNRAVARSIDAELSGIQNFLHDRLTPVDGVYGRTTVLGQMPDWNPAEMIGRAPRSLSFSLYHLLITDKAWRLARSSMGYATPTGQPLMVSLAGQPFIDTRLSFHSYLPRNLPSAIANKLVDNWLWRLRSHPELHDKIEFDIAITVFSFNIDNKIDELASILSTDERKIFRDSLHELTIPLLRNEGEGSVNNALKKIDYLSRLSLPSVTNGLSSLMSLIENCTKYGTEPFAVLARHGFIARTILLSLVDRGVLTDFDVSLFQSSVRTVASDLVDDMRRLQLEELNYDQFMVRYGHLRPGTYDILSQRYDQMQDFVNPNDNCDSLQLSNHNEFMLKASKRKAINQLLFEEGFHDLDADALLLYCSSAIAGREYGKFVFTRSVSCILELIANFGECHGLSREELSHIPINHLIDISLASSAEPSVEERLRLIAKYESARHELTSAIRLPQVLFDEAGVRIIPFQVNHPNFVTDKKVTADSLYIGSHQRVSDIVDHIILIENADPGYDWIFCSRIAGLVTKYGGANSHMAIRCAEFGIPAAIGCGEQRFESFIKSRRLSLDCAVELIIPLH